MPCSNAWNKVSLESVPQVEVPHVNYCQSSTQNEVNNASEPQINLVERNMEKV